MELSDNEFKKIAYVLGANHFFGSDNALKLLLSRRQWMTRTDAYEQGLQAMIDEGVPIDDLRDIADRLMWRL